MKTVIGIDPGCNGGLAWIRDGKPCAEKLPESPYDLAEMLRQIQREGDCLAYVEKVSASPQMGTVSAFTFGRGAGIIEGVLAALAIPVHFVRPQRWQAELGCLTKGDKNVSKLRAQQLFPSLKITHAIADALLIAEFARRDAFRPIGE